MKIPYGDSNFEQIRTGGYFYADKTPFIAELEDHYRHVVLLRPRRFGKSTFVSTLEHYYDLAKKGRFEELFGGLHIHAHPTPEQGRYLVLSLDFSGVATDRGQDALHRTFVETVRASVLRFILRYQDHLPALTRLDERLNSFQDAEALMMMLLGIVAESPHRMYVNIDEYDHFANRLLAAGAEDIYTAIVQKTGFVRTFYAALKTGTSGAIARMFITGVSPLMLDDLSSGFNITKQASFDAKLAAIAGFTRAETERAVDALLTSRPSLAELPGVGDRAALLAVLEAHYNGYRFAPGKERMFNSDMVLYFLSALDSSESYPINMLDMNVRTEYSHLQRIGALSGAGIERRRALLQTIVSEGHIKSPLIERFGVKQLPADQAFVSLLYHLGMLTLGAAPPDDEGYDLEIPNRVIRELQWEHLRLMLYESVGVTIDVSALQSALSAMVKQGDIAPFVEVFHAQVLTAFSNRDMRGLDERTIKLLLMTYASLGGAFYALSEKELAQGYSDLFLAARDAPWAKFSWLLELKYLKTGAKPAQIEAAFAEALAQVERYASDQALLPLLVGSRELRAGALVFVGAKKVLYRPWPAEAAATGPALKRAKSTAKKKGNRTR